METQEWAKAFIKEHNIPVGIDKNAKEYIKMSEGKMKKNKKFWKREAKAWREIAEMETESANHWAGEAMILQDELQELKVKFVKLKDELNIVRQYNIGKKQSNSTYTNTEAKVISLWSKNTPKNPYKNCNCKNCNCKK